MLTNFGGSRMNAQSEMRPSTEQQSQIRHMQMLRINHNKSQQNRRPKFVSQRDIEGFYAAFDTSRLMTTERGPTTPQVKTRNGARHQQVTDFERVKISIE